MSAATLIVGYPVHVLATFCRWTNPHGAGFTNWTARCGASGYVTGHRPFDTAGSARRGELCRACFGGAHWGGYFPEPTELHEPREG